MDEKLTGRPAVEVVVGLAIFLALAAGGLLMPGCKPAADERNKPAAGAIAAPKAADTATPSAARSPKELALAGFLKTMKLEGKPVLIEFGMVGCKLSGEGLDSMAALQKSNAVPGLAFVRVESGADTAAVFQGKPPAFPVYGDEQSALAKALSATAYPTFLLADKFGHIRYEGKYPQENLVPWGKALVAETHDAGGSAPMFGARELDAAKLLANALPDLKDQVRPLSEYMGAGGLIVLFVDTSCPFSAAALKDMPMVARSLAEQKINAVIVNNDDAAPKVRSFYAQSDPGAPVVYDVGAATRDRWNVHSVPRVAYIGPDKKLGYQGEAIWANMGSSIETSLGLARGAIKFTAAGTGFG